MGFPVPPALPPADAVGAVAAAATAPVEVGFDAVVTTNLARPLSTPDWQWVIMVIMADGEMATLVKYLGDLVHGANVRNLCNPCSSYV